MSILDLFRKPTEEKSKIDKGEMEFRCCLQPGSIQLIPLLETIQQAEDFKPFYIEIDGVDHVITKAVIEQLRNNDEESNKLLLEEGRIHFKDRSGYDNVTLHQFKARQGDWQVLYWKTMQPWLMNNPMMHYFFAHPGFIAAFCYNSEDNQMQNTTHLFDFERAGMKPAKVRKNEYGDKQAVPDNNPGKTFTISNTWLMSSWKMWFGNSFFNKVSKEKLLGFRVAELVSEQGNNIVHIQLYENPQEYHLVPNRKLQQAFREYIDIPSLAKQFPAH
ncbi:hypothetical protein [Pseudobacter ginsenosidimutans]|uniref:Uncharacterized protein n=1 Tax=Pseudobacter ginsenosidimutans TaxID=661488 RepID=A0A4Q7N4F7_9BACT|nr:hypothetical protein [Pseudobacter ginsenosidimutans]QEC44422.1 hypothetical protein FSB84_23110 [Pseudobacter ginsenosidimutans]RZS75893.1 hypothetical protein EV199_1769 [Pseudobacter ginsenosidimutans]